MIQCNEALYLVFRKTLFCRYVCNDFAEMLSQLLVNKYDA